MSIKISRKKRGNYGVIFMRKITESGLGNGKCSHLDKDIYIHII